MKVVYAPAIVAVLPWEGVRRKRPHNFSVDYTMEYAPHRIAQTEDGCEVAPTCFACPLPDCVWSYGNSGQSQVRDWHREQRNAKIRERSADGEDKTAIARALGISPRTVHRVLARAQYLAARGEA